MNNYMKRLVSTKKKATKEEVIPVETAPVPSSPIASRAKSNRNRINRSSSKATEVAPSSPSNTMATTAGENDKDSKPVTSNGPSPRRIRQYIRSGSNKSSGSSSKEKPPSADKTNGVNTNAAKDSWMSIAQDTDSDTDGDDLFQSPKQGPIAWEGDEGNDIPSTSTPPNPIWSTDTEKELAQVKMDRDLLQQQLSEAKAELDVARTTLQENVSEMEEQLRTLKQSERRQAELEENKLLEEEIDKLARLAREQEEATATADESMTVATEGAVKCTTGSVLSQDEISLQKTNAKLEKERELREHSLFEEIRKLKEQARIDSKKLKESQRQVQWFQKELKAMFPHEGDTSSVSSADDNAYGGENCIQDNPIHLETITESCTDDKEGTDGCIDKTSSPSINLGTTGSTIVNSTDGLLDHSNKHVKLLHKQRLELEQRVQELLEEVGMLRLGQRTHQHQKEQSDMQLLKLRTDLQEQKEKHRIDLVLVERQLEEWKGRSESLQTDLNEGRHLADHLKARREQERIERQQLSQHVEQLELEKRELKESLAKSRVDFEREKGSLSKAIETLEYKLHEKSTDSDNLYSNNADTDSAEDASSNESEAALSEPPFLVEDPSRDEGSWEKLFLRVQSLEAEREAHIETVRALEKELATVIEQEEVAKMEVAAAEDRVQVLQTFLDASFSASPKKEKQRELQQEYLSVKSRTHHEDLFNQEEFHEVDPANVVDPESPKSVKNLELNSDSIRTEDDTFYDAQQKPSELSTHLGQNRSPESQKLPDIDEQSMSSDAVVQNLHSKLEEEMGNLQKRKERRRLRAVSSGLLQSSPKSIDVKGEKVNDEDFDTERTDDFHLTQIEKAKLDDEVRKRMEEENSRLGTALETANYEKAQLEIELQDVLEKTKNSSIRIETLDAEIIKYQSSEEDYEKGKRELMDKISIMKNETETLENKISETEEEKNRLEAKLSDLKLSSDAKDKIILENDELYRIKLEEMKKELHESLGVREINHNDSKQICDLEAKILLIEAESKSNIELVSKNLDSVLEERNSLELKLRDTRMELEQLKASESELRAAAQDIVEKLESAQDDMEKLSESKELESNELAKTVAEKNQQIAELEENLSRKVCRLEQASLQLSEMEKELFERDEEIERLDAKRLEVQENASKQLVEMESLLGQDGEDIDRLEEEKSKLQALVQSQENQLEKQLGRLAEASVQLSELESELIAKDDEIEEMELKINAMQALEAQRSESSQDPEVEKLKLEKQLETSNQTIQKLTSQVETLKQDRESGKTESKRLLMEDDKKSKEIISRQNQLDRQLQNVSKLTEQNDQWQLQLEKAYEEKHELLDRLSDAQTEVASLRKQLDDSNEKIKELNAINKRLQEDLVCATEEDEKNRVRISQMEEQKEALSQELESATDNLAELLKQNEEVREIDEQQKSCMLKKMQANMEMAQAVDEETEKLIKSLSEQVEFERKSLHASEAQRSELESENKSLKNHIRVLTQGNSK